MNITPTQIHLIYKLDAMRRIIERLSHQQDILTMAQRAHDLAFPIPLDSAFNYKIAGKDRTLNILANEIRTFEKSKSEIEVIRFQLSSTILMLMLQFIEGTMEDLLDILTKNMRLQEIINQKIA